MMRLMNKFVAYLVLAAYTIQILAPVAYAMETLSPIDSFGSGPFNQRPPSPRGEELQHASLRQFIKSQIQPKEEPFKDKNLSTPTKTERKNAAQILRRFQEGQLNGSPECPQARNFQYELSFDTLMAGRGQFQITLSRKAKGSMGPFEFLHRAALKNGQFTKKFMGSQDDDLRNLFQGAFIDQELDRDKKGRFVWNILGIGTIKITSKGSVILKQDDSAPLLTAYDLILNTTGNLFIQSLKINALTLNSPHARVAGSVVANHLQVNQTLINDGVLHVGKLTGSGQLINHSHLTLEGSEQSPAIVGICHLQNEKGLSPFLTPVIKSSHLHITSENLSFSNKKGAEFNVKENLLVDEAVIGSASFLNAGTADLGEVIMNRQVTNTSFWKAHKMIVDSKPFTNKHYMTILDELIINSHLNNEGDLVVKKHLQVNTALNKGTIKNGITDELKITVNGEMINEGSVFLHHLDGIGGFYNHHDVRFQGAKSNIPILGLFNETKRKDQRATIKGQRFYFPYKACLLNHADSEIDVDQIAFSGEELPFLNSTGYKNTSPILNIGTIRAKEIFLDGPIELNNSGNINLGLLYLRGGMVSNFGILDLDRLFMISGKVHNDKQGKLHVKGNVSIDDGHLQNDGHLQTEPNKQREGLFLQETGEFVNQGTWMHRGLVYLGSTNLKNSGIIHWQNGTWKSSNRDYINQGTWVFDQIRCPKPIAFNNYGTIEFNNSTLNLNHFQNHRKVITRGGHYQIETLINTNTYQDGIMSFQHQPCVFNVGTLSHRGELQVDPAIKQLLTIRTSENFGKMVGRDLSLDIQDTFKNRGQMAIQDVSGEGTLINQKHLQFNGTAHNPSRISIKNFDSSPLNAQIPEHSVQVTGSHIIVTPENKQFTTQEKTEMIVTSLIFSPLAGNPFTGPAVTPAFMNKGYLQTNELTLHRQGLVNAGSMRTSILTVSGWQFENAKGAYLQVDQDVNANVSVLQNNGEISSQGKFKQKSGKLNNSGRWTHTGDFDLAESYKLFAARPNPVELTNTGTLNSQGQFSLQQGNLNNTGTWHHTGPLTLNGTAFMNGGTLNSQGSYSHLKGSFTNAGSWDQTGDIYFGYTQLSNTGKMEWRKGLWRYLSEKKNDLNSFSHLFCSAFALVPLESNLRADSAQPMTPSQLQQLPQIEIENKGHWILDQMTCPHYLSVTNWGTLLLQGGTLNCVNLINHNILELYAGQYFVGCKFENNHILRFLENDWSFFDNEQEAKINSSSTDKLVVAHPNFINFGPSSSIESQKRLAYFVPHLPPSMTSASDIYFTQKYRHFRTLDDLYRIKANGRVTLYLPRLRIDRNHEFGNIGHLDLFIDGTLKVLYELKAPALTLTINGPFIFEELWNSNINHYQSQLSAAKPSRTVAATAGPLNVMAHNIDARFGILSSVGSTTLTSTIGDILLSSGVRGIGYIDPQFGYPVGTYLETSDFKMNIGNGTYLVSGGPLTINSARDISLQYGDMYCESHTKLKAARDVINNAGKVRSVGPVKIEAINYQHTRDPFERKRWYIIGANYSDQHIDFPGSRAASIESGGNIEFYVQFLHNLASDFSSFGNIIINGKDIDTKPTAYVEQTISVTQDALLYPWRTLQVGKRETIHPHILFAKKFKLTIGQVTIKGTICGSSISIQSVGNKDNSISSLGHWAKRYLEFQLISLYDYLNTGLAHNPIIKKTPEGAFMPVILMGMRFKFPTKQVVRLMPSQPTQGQSRPHLPFNVNRKPVLRPFGNLSCGMINLGLQDILMQHTGKNYVRGSKGGDLLTTLWDYNRELYANEGIEYIDLDKLKKTSNALLISGIREGETQDIEDIYVAISGNECRDVIGLYADEGNIEFQSKGSADFSGAHLVAKKNVHIKSEEELKLNTLIERVFTPHGYRDVVSAETKIEATEGSVTAIGKTGFKMRGASIRALFDIVAGSTHGNTEIEDILLQQLTTTTHQDGDEETTTTQQIESSHASEVISKHGSTKVICGEDHKTRITGSQIKALINIIFEGGEVETNARAAINSTHTTSHTEEMFSSKSTTNNQQSATLYPTLLEAQNIYTKTKVANYRGTDFIADVFVDDTEEGAYLGPTIAKLEYLQQYISESPMAKSDVGTQGWYEVMQPCRLMVREVVRTIDKGVLKLESVIRDEDRTKFLCKFAETVYHLKSGQTSWNKTEQAIPDAALVVVALGISIATQGWGAGFAANTLGLGTTASGIFGAGVGSIATQFGTTAIRTGDPLSAAASLFTDQYLRSLGTTLLTSGGGAGNLQGFTQRLMVNGLRSVVKASVSSVIEKKDFGSCLKEGGVSALVESIGGAIAEKIGQGANAKINPLSPIEHKLAHFALGMGSGAATGALLGHDNVLEDALTGGAGAVIGECVAESLADREKLAKEARIETYEAKGEFDEEYFEATYRAKLQPYVDIGRLVAGGVIAATGRDPTMAISAATIALENNYMGPGSCPELGGIDPEVSKAMWNTAGAIKEAIHEVMEDIRRNPDKYVEEATITATPYGDIVRRVANGEKVSALEFGIETGLVFLPAGKIVKVGAQIGGKVGAKFASAIAKRVEKNGARGTHHLAKTRKDNIAHDGYYSRKAERSRTYNAQPAAYTKHTKAKTEEEARLFSMAGNKPAAQYLPNVNNASLEKRALKDGIFIEQPGGKNYYVYRADKIIGYNNGRPTAWIRVELSKEGKAFFHGHPILEQDALLYLKDVK